MSALSLLGAFLAGVAVGLLGHYAKALLRLVRTKQRRRKTGKVLDAPCPATQGAKHDWAVAVHGPGGSTFECTQCGASFP